MTDTPEPTGPTPFFASTPAGDGSRPPSAPSVPAPLAPGVPTSPTRYEPAPLTAPDGQDGPALEELLRDVRGALATLPGEPGDVSYPPPPRPGLAELEGAVSDLRAAVAELHDAQRVSNADVTTRLEALATELSTRLEPAAAPPAPGDDDVTLQDLHDGLAGVRTDVAGLPDLLGPAVTSAVGHGIAGPTRQLEAMTTALADTTHESGQLRAELAGLQVQLAALHEQASLLPQVQAGLRDVTERLADLESLSAAPMPDISAIVDQRLAEHLTAFGGGLGERLDAQLVSIQGTLGSIPRDDVAAHLEGTERRLAQQLDAMRAADTSDERLSQLEQRLGERIVVLDRQIAAQSQLAEQRLVRHVDEAVLALAQAVLGGRPAAPDASPTGAVADVPPSRPSSDPLTGPSPVAFESTPLDPTGLDQMPLDQMPLDPLPPPVTTELPALPGSSEPPAPPEPPADLEPVPVYGTANLGLAPPAPTDTDTDTDTDGEPAHGGGGDPVGGVEAWAKGDDRYAELPDLQPDMTLPADVPDVDDAPPGMAAPDDVPHDAAPHDAAPQQETPHEGAARDDAGPGDVQVDDVLPDDVLPDPPPEPSSARKGLFRRRG